MQPRPARCNTTASAGSVDDIFGTLDKLLQGSTAMQQNTSRFEQRLSAANEEIRRLRSEIETLRQNAMNDEIPASSTAAPSMELAQFLEPKATGAQ